MQTTKTNLLVEALVYGSENVEGGAGNDRLVLLLHRRNRITRNPRNPPHLATPRSNPPA